MLSERPVEETLHAHEATKVVRLNLKGSESPRTGTLVTPLGTG